MATGLTAPAVQMSARTYTNIQKGLAEIAQARYYADQLASCDIDCQQQFDDIDATQRTLEALKARFFPDKP